MATQKITYRFATGCGTIKQVGVKDGQQPQVPFFCGQPMQEVARD